MVIWLLRVDDAPGVACRLRDPFPGLIARRFAHAPGPSAPWGESTRPAGGPIGRAGDHRGAHRAAPAPRVGDVRRGRSTVDQRAEAATIGTPVAPGEDHGGTRFWRRSLSLRDDPTPRAGPGARASRATSATGPDRCAGRPIGATREYLEHHVERYRAILDRSIDQDRPGVLDSSPNP